MFRAVDRLQRFTSHLEFKHWFPGLLGDPRYTEGVERILEKFSAGVVADVDKRKSEAEEELATLGAELGRTNGEVNDSVHQERNSEGNDVVQQNARMVNGSGAATKEERRFKEVQQQQQRPKAETVGAPRALAAGAGNIDRKTPDPPCSDSVDLSGNRPTLDAWPKTVRTVRICAPGIPNFSLKDGRRLYPQVGGSLSRRPSWSHG